MRQVGITIHREQAHIIFEVYVYVLNRIQSVRETKRL